MTNEKREELRREITSAINRVSAENDSDTPDYILADYIMACFDAFTVATIERRRWYSRTKVENA